MNPTSEAEVPSILYKYCSPKGLPILKNRLLKVTRPIEFNDPFEFTPVPVGRITPEHVQLRLQDPEWIPRKKMERESSMLELSKVSPFRRWKLYENLADKFNEDLRSSLLEHLPWVSKDFGVLCFSADPASVLMWSHYADNHRGFVIGVDHRKLGQLQILKVEYEDRRVEIPATSYLWKDEGVSFGQKIITHKSPEWSYEKEYRLLVQLADPHLVDVEICGPCKALPLGDAIVEVWLGVRTSQELGNEISEALRLSGSKVEPQRFKLDPHKYRLQVAT